MVLRSVVLWSALAAVAAHGQDAMFSSAALEQSTAANTSALNGQPYWGPVQYALGLYAGTSYNDNGSNSETNPQSDVVSRFGTALSLGWSPTGNSQMQLGGGIGYVDDETIVSNTGLDIRPNSALSYAITLADLTVTFFDQLSYTREVRNQPALANVGYLPQLNNNTGFQAEWDIGHWVLTGSYSYDENMSDSANSYLNRSADYLYGRAAWRFAEATQAGFEASDAFTRYANVPQNNNQNLSVGGYLDWAVIPSLHVELRGGPVFYDAQGAVGTSSSSLDSYYVSGLISYQMTDFLTHSVNLQRSLQAGLNQGGSYVEQLTASYAISWAVTQRIGLGVFVNYTDGKQPLGYGVNPNSLTLTSANEDYEQYGGGFQISWRFTDHISAVLGYTHSQRTSNLAGRANTDNVESIQFNYSF